MRQKERRDSGRTDLFRARLDQIVDMSQQLAKLGATIDWRFLEGAAGQPLRRPHARDRCPGDRGADRRGPLLHHRRPRLSRPQCAARPPNEGLCLRPEARRHRRHQARPAPALGGRTRHRPRQGRAPHGPQLPRELTATPPTRSSPPPATISAGSSRSSPSFGAPSSWRCSPTPKRLPFRTAQRLSPRKPPRPQTRATSRSTIAGEYEREGFCGHGISRFSTVRVYAKAESGAYQ
jgi:hypothetical protein